MAISQVNPSLFWSAPAHVERVRLSQVFYDNLFSFQQIIYSDAPGAATRGARLAVAEGEPGAVVICWALTVTATTNLLVPGPSENRTL